MENSNIILSKPAEPSSRVLVVEAPTGNGRRHWIERHLQHAAESGKRVFDLSCHFNAAGPWAGVNTLFSILLPEMQVHCPDLVQRHSLELVYILPQLRRQLRVSNPTLTDLAKPQERVRSYPVDRAFRIVHGLIDLLDAWKRASEPHSRWLIVCNGYDHGGAMSSEFFKHLMRRRGAALSLEMVLVVDQGNGENTRNLFAGCCPATLLSLNIPAEPTPSTDPGLAAEMAEKIEEEIGGDLLETHVHLADLIRLWSQAGRAEKVMRYKSIGMNLCNTLGLYADALRYAENLMDLVRQHYGQDAAGVHEWSIVARSLNMHLGLQDVSTTLTLAEGQAMELAASDPARLADLFYTLAMLYARYKKPRDLAKGEEYLERGLEALERANLPEDQRHFQAVFNRNGLAMIRNFQGRHAEAIELCRSGLARLNAHLDADKHKLHRSVLLYNLGQVYLATGEAEEALKYYAAAMEMDPNYSEYYNERGSIYLQLGECEKALADYLKATELSPPYFEVFTNLGQCYRRMSLMEDATHWYSRAIDLEPNRALAWLGRAMAYEDLGNVKAAIADYTEALRLDSTLWDAYANRGSLYYEAGDLPASLADLSHAIEIKPHETDLYQNRAIVLRDLGQCQDAARDLRLAIDLISADEDKTGLQDLVRTLEQENVSGVSAF